VNHQHPAHLSELLARGPDRQRTEHLAASYLACVCVCV
jgi:hypothetical protein